VLQPFGIRKETLDFGISAEDDNDDSETSYTGDGVTPLAMAIAQDAPVPAR
jgi:hypothetical protein